MDGGIEVSVSEPLHTGETLNGDKRILFESVIIPIHHLSGASAKNKFAFKNEQFEIEYKITRV